MRGSNYIRVRISLRTHLLFIVLLAALACPSLFAYPPQKSTDLATQSIEDLMNIQVTSVSKTEEKLSRTASAVFVIAQEDIRSSGAANIPDLLRMVPGMDVGQVDSNTWAISARGFNAQFSNKLLVMVDGRSVYTPTFAGVFWETFDLPLEDIERIEVIRGPGGTQWGSNAVNGVLNVITKKASETRGGMAVAGGGTLNRGFGTLQYGERFGKSTDVRVFAKYLDQSPLPSLVGQSGGDGWNMLRGGFRADSAISQEDDVTVQGDLYTWREGEAVLPFGALVGMPMVASMGGGYLQAVWNNTYAAGSNTTLQISDDRYERNLPFRDARNTVDVDFQHRFVWADRHDIVWGASYRYTNHRSNSAHIHYDASDNIRQIFGSFVQGRDRGPPEPLVRDARESGLSTTSTPVWSPCPMSGCPGSQALAIPCGPRCRARREPHRAEMLPTTSRARKRRDRQAFRCWWFSMAIRIFRMNDYSLTKRVTGRPSLRI